MTKSEFKKLYSTYRKEIRSFDEYMSSSNFPCGHDDYLYERFYDSLNNWIDQNPAFRAFLNVLDQWDELEWRWQDWHVGGRMYPETLKRSIHNRLVA